MAAIPQSTATTLTADSSVAQEDNSSSLPSNRLVFTASPLLTHSPTYSTTHSLINSLSHQLTHYKVHAHTHHSLKSHEDRHTHAHTDTLTHVHTLSLVQCQSEKLTHQKKFRPHVYTTNHSTVHEYHYSTMLFDSNAAAAFNCTFKLIHLALWSALLLSYSLDLVMQATLSDPPGHSLKSLTGAVDVLQCINSLSYSSLTQLAQSVNSPSHFTDGFSWSHYST